MLRPLAMQVNHAVRWLSNRRRKTLGYEAPNGPPSNFHWLHLQVEPTNIDKDNSIQKKSFPIKKLASDNVFYAMLSVMSAAEDRLLSTAEAAAQLGVTRQRVLELITDERLPARKVGRAYVIRAGDVASLELRRVGRPPKTGSGPPKPKNEPAPKARGVRVIKKGGRK